MRRCTRMSTARIGGCPPRDGEAQQGRVRTRRGAHAGHRVLLVHAQARVRGDVSLDESQAPTPLHYEFAGRHNVRPLDTVDQMKLIARSMTGRRLKYRDLIAD